jgi:oligopeptide transport system substrate-binding protein
MKRLLRLLVVVTLLVGLVGVTPFQAVGEGEKVLRMVTSGAYDNLDPRILLSTSHSAVQNAFIEALVRSVGSKINPGMAESWDISDDGTVYTFYLRDAEWSDGKPVTARDFVHAFERLFEVCPASPIFDDILNGPELRSGEVGRDALGVKALDEKTIEITLKAPAPYFLGLLSVPFAGPGREDLVEKFGEEYGASVASLASNGPFILSEWIPEDKVVLVKNEDYWDADSIKLDKVVFSIIPDANTQRNLFDNGDIDILSIDASLLNEQSMQAYRDSGELVEYERGGIRCLQLNRYGYDGDPEKAKILNNPNFMKAISYALDRQGWVDGPMNGLGIPATVQTPAAHTVYSGTTWGEVTPNIGKYHPTTVEWEKSQEYLLMVMDDMGYSSVNEFPEFIFLTTDLPEDPATITAYVHSVLIEMGLKVKIVNKTGTDFYNTLYKPALGYDIVRAGWGPDYDDPYTYMGYWNSKSTDMGVTFDNEDFDALLLAANSETDLVKRAQILVEAEALFSDIAPCIPIYHNKGVILIKTNVEGVVLAISGMTVNYLYADIK